MVAIIIKYIEITAMRMTKMTMAMTAVDNSNNDDDDDDDYGGAVEQQSCF